MINDKRDDLVDENYATWSQIFTFSLVLSEDSFWKTKKIRKEGFFSAINLRKYTKLDPTFDGN